MSLDVKATEPDQARSVCKRETQKNSERGRGKKTKAAE